ncbi:hypothetical protein OHB26_33370 [Nocardia sp. NBC_01503]|uniref:hypothetical protein n=1 Tax=Nocardia sp. NBC_01503 TaxID=2975997 RepID=UPI002E7B37B3|nr:hypothetical protein [Nocardia sp. NBC_01503]WTL31744.1 hypothetical protein OHB26_33370 [Nocardia sp. NBC_01503]
MPFEEKRTRILGVAAVVSYTIYLIVVLTRARPHGLSQVGYISPLLWAVGGSILVSIVATIAVAIAARDDRKDQRDREIDRMGTLVGNAFVVLGAVGALVLTMADAERFWIANVIYLGFTLSAAVGASAKIIAYRRGYWPW